MYNFWYISYSFVFTPFLLSSAEIITYLPTYPHTYVRKNKLITISKPLFPSYIFTYQSHPVFKIRDTYINYVNIKGKPLTISQKIIDDIKKLEEEIKLGTIIAAEPTTFAPNDLVMISEGPLIGKKAIVLYSNNTIVKFKLLDSGYITKTQHKNLIKISY